MFDFEDVTFLMAYNTRCSTFLNYCFHFEWLFGIFVTVSEIKRECDVVTALVVDIYVGADDVQYFWSWFAA